MTSPGGREVGRVSIRVVPDTSRFRRDLRAALAGLGDEGFALDGTVSRVRRLGSAMDETTASVGRLRRGLRNIDAGVRTTREGFNEFREALRRQTEEYRRANPHVSRMGVAFRALRSNVDMIDRSARRFSTALNEIDEANRRIYPNLNRLGRGLVNSDALLRRGVQSFRDYARNSRLVDGTWGRLTRTLRDVDAENRRIFPNLNRFGRALVNLDGLSRRSAEGIRELSRQAGRVSVDRIRQLRREIDIEKVVRRTGRAIGALGRMPFTGTVRGLRGIHKLQRDIRDESSRLRQVLDRVRDGFSRVRTVVDRLTPSFIKNSTAANRNRNRILLLSAAVLALLAPAGALISGALTALPSLLGAVGLAAGAVALGLDGIKRAAKTLEPEFNRLKEVVSGVFEERLTPQFAQLKSMFPLFETGFSQIANGMANMSQGVVDVVTSVKGMQQLETIFANTGTLLTNLKPYVSDLTSTFLTLNEVGSQNFHLLSQSMNTWASNFKATVNALVADGSMDKMFLGLKQFSDGFGNLFNDIYAIGVRAMGQLGGTMGNFLTQFGQVLKTLEPGLISFADSVLKAIGSFGVQVSPEFSIFLQNLGQTLLTLEPILTSLVNNGLSVLNTAMTTLGPAVQQLTPGLQALFTTLANAANQALPKLGPALEQVAMAFSTMMQDPAFQGALTGFIVAFTDALNQLLPILVQNAPAITQLATNLLQLATMALPFVTAGVQAALGVFQVFIGAVTALVEVFRSAAGAVPEAVQAIKAAITGNFSDAGSLLMEAGRQVVQGLINGIQSMIGAAVSAAKTVASAVANAAKSVLGINSPSKVFHEYGENVGQGLANGIDAQQEQAVKSAKSLADALQQVFGDEQKINIAIIVGDYKSSVDDFASQTSKAAKSVKNAGAVSEKAYGEMDDATKKQKELLQLRADELQMESRRLDNMADTAENRRRKQMLQEQIDALQEQADEMDMQAKKMAYENKWGEAYDTILDEIEQIPPEAESKGLTIMQRLQKGLKDGWSGVQRELRLMADDFGEVFGVANMSGEIDKIADQSGFASIPQDFAKATTDQFLSDIGAGGGVLGGVMNEGIQYVFNVMTMDEALQAKQTEENRNRLRYIGR